MKAFPSKRLPNIFARIRPPSQRRFVFTGLKTFNQNGYLIIHTTFALRDLGVNNVCEKIILYDIQCASCNKFNQVCRSFVKESCLRVYQAPYVCNGCNKPLHRCSVPHKYRYDAVFAQRKYEELRTSSRTGVNLTKHQALQMNAVVAPLIEQGRSPYVIVTNHPELGISEFGAPI